MKGNLKIIGSNNDIMPLGEEYDAAELIENKLIVNWRAIDSTTAEPVLEEKVLTLDIKNVNICDNFVHVDAWFVDEERNGGRVEFKLEWT
jgi:hypothetical protein